MCLHNRGSGLSIVHVTMSQNSTSRPTRAAAIDLMRGASVLGIILLHLNIRVPFERSAVGQSLSKPLSSCLFWSGYHAVSVFFVISGFLITTRVEARDGSVSRVDVGAFYRRRFARIAPCLLLFCAVQSALQGAGVAGFAPTIQNAKVSLTCTVFSALTFHLNWLEAVYGYLPGAWDVLWSLCIEEVFYLGYPLILRGVRRLALVVALCFGFIAVGPFSRVAWSNNEIWADHAYLSCMGEIALGCLAALYVRRRVPSQAGALALFIAGCSALSLVFYFKRMMRDLHLYAAGLDVTVLALGAACVLIAVTASRPLARVSEHRAFRLLTWLGRNSYEVYLSHLFIILPATHLFELAKSSPNLLPGFYLCVIVACALLGALITEAFSKPLERKLSGPADLRVSASNSQETA